MGSPTTYAYGVHPDQWVRVHLPSERAPRGVVVVLHGGFWKAAYGAEWAEPLSADLAARGWAAVTVEYRRVGGGGGFPETLDDVHAALALLADPERGPGLDLGGLVVLGHSAGGHLAAWAEARHRAGDGRWTGGPEVAHVVSQAGVLDLAAAWGDGLGGDAVEAFLGGSPAEADAAYRAADPTWLLPPRVPVSVLHARDDDEVPFAQAEAYTARVLASGGTARLVEVGGGHYDLVDVTTPAWAAVVDVLASLSR
ncbi:MAG: alpha/beta hydrolase [Nocardioides sp.]|uniref:alpha/beta hydrolase n=1 Tax=Nocardioides sp. TaxID=35761 RepID=UPI003F088975